MTNPQRTCKVCWAPVDDEGFISHGSGCYTQSPEGGGSEYVGLPVTTTENEDEIKTGFSHLIPEGGFKKGQLSVIYSKRCIKSFL
jgi:hypothetical protein